MKKYVIKLPLTDKSGQPNYIAIGFGEYRLVVNELDATRFDLDDLEQNPELFKVMQFAEEATDLETY